MFTHMPELLTEEVFFLVFPFGGLFLGSLWVNVIRWVAKKGDTTC